MVNEPIGYEAETLVPPAWKGEHTLNCAILAVQTFLCLDLYYFLGLYNMSYL